MMHNRLTARLEVRLQNNKFSPDLVMPAPIFRERIRHERDCADRNHHCFTIITFESLVKLSSRFSKKLLPNLISERIRSMDLLGKLDRDHLAVLLLYTSSVGASIVARKMAETMHSHGLDLKITSRTYPEDFGSNGTKNKDLPKELMELEANKAGQSYSKPLKASGDGKKSRNQSYFEKKRPFWKIVFDVLGATIGLIGSFPLLIIVSLAIKLNSKGPIIFKQTRIGLGERPFTFYKFRSMQSSAERRQASLKEFNDQTGPVFKMKQDPRITSVGVFIRKWSIDELPQLWNILKGDMSIVGPRPLICEEAEEYYGWYRSRFNVKPGLTCIWQVSGRSEIQFEQRIKMDVNYAKSCSFWLDFLILLKTLPAVLNAKGAY